MNRALIDLYRCPESFVEFELTGPLSNDVGYYRFGKDTICYGRSASQFRAKRSDDVLCDISEDMRLAESGLHLPFDPTEVINNLRLESYAKYHAQHSLDLWKRHIRNIYYLLRPVLPSFIRTRLQRAYLEGWQNLAFPHWPVDTTVETLCEQLIMLSLQAKRSDRIPFIWFWPDGARSCVTLTHDVETDKGMDFCHELMRIDESFGFKAAIQVVPESKYTICNAFIENIHKSGFELNIQDLNHDGNLFRDEQEFRKRARRINEYAKGYRARGFRAAVLYRNMDWLNELQFSFDMSVPNVAHLDPQRGGCCTVMPYFVGNILEIPVTTTQDYTLFNILNVYSLDLWKAQTELITKKHGLVSFIVHPDYVIEKRARRSYEALLKFLKHMDESRGVWFALPSEIDDWWRARSRMSLVNQNGIWKIQGHGAERAKLAFAKLSAGCLEYEVVT
jgi:hypothetical protein